MIIISFKVIKLIIQSFILYAMTVCLYAIGFTLVTSCYTPYRKERDTKPCQCSFDRFAYDWACCPGGEWYDTEDGQ